MVAVVVVTLLALAGCTEDDPAPSSPLSEAAASASRGLESLNSAIDRFSQSLPDEPSTPPVAPVPTQELPTGPPVGSYPLSEQQALNLLSSGTAVAGRVEGGEGVARKTTETVYEKRQVLRETCPYEYDPDEGKEVQNCRDEYVTEEVPRDIPAYTVSLLRNGQWASDLTFRTAQEAIAQIRAYGATEWRTA
ncbi:hypothetical protein ACFQ69_33050 [Streptomyces sp. NPDC056470]|uniref:hypothetical protein n=1 Tax=Streptomyces sp. NPDC056470 TaxID=3345831 RepID=UPI00369DF510